MSPIQIFILGYLAGSLITPLVLIGIVSCNEARDELQLRRTRRYGRPIDDNTCNPRGT